MKKITKMNKQQKFLRTKFLKMFAKKNRRKTGKKTYKIPYYNSLINSPGKPVWSGREYSKFADEGYIKNVIAHRCIAMIASGAANIPWQLNKIVAGRKQQISEHPLLDILNKPNPCCGGVEFLEAVYSHKLISGNAYIQLVRDNNNMPAELFSLRPDRITIIAGKGSIPQSYKYSVGDNNVEFKVDHLTGKSDLLHIKKFNPLDDWYGLSSIEPAAYSIDQHNEAGTWNQSLLQNGARPSGALIIKSGENGEYDRLSEEQFLRLKQQVDDVHSGAANVGRPLLLEGGLEWKEMSISPKDMDFINTKNSAARDIALAFGVPPQLLGIPGDATYNNMAEARLSLWEQTILPMVDNMVSSLNNWLIPLYNKKLQLSIDLDEVTALAPRREAAWQRAKDADFLSNDEKKKVVGV